jgi:hypothetical protein
MVPRFCAKRVPSSATTLGNSDALLLVVRKKTESAEARAALLPSSRSHLQKQDGRQKQQA